MPVFRDHKVPKNAQRSVLCAGIRPQVTQNDSNIHFIVHLVAQRTHQIQEPLGTPPAQMNVLVLEVEGLRCATDHPKDMIGVVIGLAEAEPATDSPP
jgi:hypothetical protein